MGLASNRYHLIAKKRCFSVFLNKWKQNKFLTIIDLHFERISDRRLFCEKYASYEGGKTAKFSVFNTYDIPSHAYIIRYLTTFESLFWNRCQPKKKNLVKSQGKLKFYDYFCKKIINIILIHTNYEEIITCDVFAH